MMKRVIMILLVAVSLATAFAAGALAGPGESGGVRPQTSMR